MEHLWQALQQSGLAGHIRQSEFIYPAANVLHVVGVIAFYGLVAAMDLTLLARSGGAAMSQALRPWAIGALLLVAAAGFMLFAADAVAVAANPAFRLKLLLIMLAIINFAVHLCTSDAALQRTTAVVSLLAWLAVAALGRYIAYI